MLLGACASSEQAAAEEPVVSDTGEETAAEPVTIKVVSFLTYDENTEGAEAQVVAAFQEAHPEITVDFSAASLCRLFHFLKDMDRRWNRT